MLRPYQEAMVERVHEAFRKGLKSACIVLPCGAGKSVIVAEIAKKTTEKNNRVLFLVHRRELCQQIEKTFRMWGVDMDLCEICMIQTACRRLKKLKNPSLIISDESHHSKSKSYQNVHNFFTNSYRLGVTATPVRLDGSGLGDVYATLIEGVSAKWLIKNGYLSPYNYYAPTLADMAGIKTEHGDFETKSIEKILMKSTIYGDVVRYYRQLADGKQAICYCSSVEHSKAMAENFCQAGISAVHIDGETPKNKRDEIIDSFRCQKITILCNVDLISEGFDVPDCECAILLRPTKSLTLYIQQSMRCMRYKDNKTAIIIDHVGNYARHGLPDDDRQWTLEGKKKMSKKCQNHSVTIKELLMCPECFFTFEPEENAEKICPACDYVFPKKERNIETKQDVRLERITNFKLDFSSPDKCKSYSDLIRYAKSKNYKIGWAYYQAKQRGFL